MRMKNFHRVPNDFRRRADDGLRLMPFYRDQYRGGCSRLRRVMRRWKLWKRLAWLPKDRCVQRPPVLLAAGFHHGLDRYRCVYRPVTPIIFFFYGFPQNCISISCGEWTSAPIAKSRSQRDWIRAIRAGSISATAQQINFEACVNSRYPRWLSADTWVGKRMQYRRAQPHHAGGQDRRQLRRRAGERRVERRAGELPRRRGTRRASLSREL